MSDALPDRRICRRRRRLAAEHGISEWAFATPERPHGRISPHRDPFAPSEFERTASELLGAEVDLFSDPVPGREHVSPDLVTAQGGELLS